MKKSFILLVFCLSLGRINAMRVDEPKYVTTKLGTKFVKITAYEEVDGGAESKKVEYIAIRNAEYLKQQDAAIVGGMLGFMIADISHIGYDKPWDMGRIEQEQARFGKKIGGVFALSGFALGADLYRNLSTKKDVPASAVPAAVRAKMNNHNQEDLRWFRDESDISTPQTPSAADAALR